MTWNGRFKVTEANADYVRLVAEPGQISPEDSAQGIASMELHARLKPGATPPELGSIITASGSGFVTAES